MKLPNRRHSCTHRNHQHRVKQHAHFESARYSTNHVHGIPVSHLRFSDYQRPVHVKNHGVDQPKHCAQSGEHTNGAV